MDIINGEKSSQPLSAGLYTELQRDILSGAIPDGSKLTEQAVCKRYGVSRTPVREAFRQLEADGLIDNIPNKGAFVTGLTKRDISDLFDLRILFEVQAVEWAIKRMSSEEIDELAASAREKAVLCGEVACAYETDLTGRLSALISRAWKCSADLEKALENAGIACRLEKGPTGGHGFSDGTGMCMEGWPERAIDWFEGLPG